MKSPIKRTPSLRPTLSLTIKRHKSINLRVKREILSFYLGIPSRITGAWLSRTSDPSAERVQVTIPCLLRSPSGNFARFDSAAQTQHSTVLFVRQRLPANIDFFGHEISISRCPNCHRAHAQRVNPMKKNNPGIACLNLTLMKNTILVLPMSSTQWILKQRNRKLVTKVSMYPADKKHRQNVNHILFVSRDLNSTDSRRRKFSTWKERESTISPFALHFLYSARSVAKARIKCWAAGLPAVTSWAENEAVNDDLQS